MPPSLGESLRVGLRAFARAPWLVAPGLLVAAAGQVLLWPAWATAWALLGRAALLGLETAPLRPLAPLEAVVATATSTRFLALVTGLALAGGVAHALLRVAFVAGAFPTLAGAAAGDRSTPRFAAGLAYGFPRVLAAAALAFAVRLGAGLFGLVLALAALPVVLSLAGGGGSALLAAAVALALTLAVAVPIALGTVADASVARAAILQEGPATALAGAAERFARRPGTFVVAALLLSMAGLAVAASLQAFGSLATGFVADDVPALVTTGPTLMLAAAGATLAALVDLVRLGTFAALACAEER